MQFIWQVVLRFDISLKRLQDSLYESKGYKGYRIEGTGNFVYMVTLRKGSSSGLESSEE
jgi:hypothetical protein